MIKIKRALISVSDKKNVVELARLLASKDIEILSTGGTAKLLRKNKIPVIEVEEYTNFPEMLGGRVKHFIQKSMEVSWVFEKIKTISKQCKKIIFLQ